MDSFYRNFKDREDEVKFFFLTPSPLRKKVTEITVKMADFVQQFNTFKEVDLTKRQF